MPKYLRKFDSKWDRQVPECLKHVWTPKCFH